MGIQWNERSHKVTFQIISAGYYEYNTRNINCLLLFIRFSVDRRIFLIGYGVYGSMQGSAIYEVLIELIHTASGKVIASNSSSFSSDGSKYTYRLMFKELAEILPNTIYTASATFKVCI